MSHPEFSLDDPIIYLNHAAVAPWPRRTEAAVKAFAEQNTHCGSMHYPEWLKQEKQIRQQLKVLLNAPSVTDIALVKNTSEALSFVAYGLEWNKGDNIVSSDEEFPSNRIPWQSLENQGVEFRQADLQACQSAEDALFAMVDSNTRLISISSIQFASGRRMDLQRIGQFCQENNILFCIDAIQSLGAVEFDVQAYQADFVMADGHKWMFGPEGLGVFYTNPASRAKLKLTQYGWHMIANIQNYENKPWDVHPSAQRFECGSPNMLGIHAWSASLSLLLEIGMDSIEADVIKNASYIMAAINAHPKLILLSNDRSRLKSGIVLFKHTEIDNNRLYQQLLKNCIICALRGGGIRFSPHFYHSKKELDRVFEILDILK